jgi:2'-5' RNA ligase
MVIFHMSKTDQQIIKQIQHSCVENLGCSVYKSIFVPHITLGKIPNSEICMMTNLTYHLIET